MADPVLHLLSDGKLRAVVLDALDKIYGYAGTIYDNPQEDMEGIEGEELWEEAWWRARICGGDRDVETAFEEYLFDKMSQPQRVTPAEISDAFWALARPLQYRSPDYDREYAEAVYASLLNSVGNHLLSWRDSSPFTVARIAPAGEGSWKEMGPWIAHGKLSEPDVGLEAPQEQGAIWSSNGLEVCCAGPSPCTDMAPVWNNKFCYLNVRVAGHISEQALQDLTAELTRTLPSVIRSLTSIQRPPTLAEVLLLVPCNRSLPVLTKGRGILTKNVGFLRRCLDAYFSKPTKKDSLDRRIHNAVSLLVESDMQSNQAVGLAMSIAAIEALLGEKGESVAERLSSNLAVLLEPDLEMRLNAKEFFKSLYGLRSDALHGRSVDDIGGYRQSARCVGAAVLHSVMAREDFLRRSGYDAERPDQLLRDLEKLHWSAGQPMGISVLPVTQLWRKSGAT